MFQQVLVIILFAGATAYLGWQLWRHLTAKSACATGCGKCGGVIDVEKIAKEYQGRKS